MKRPIFKYALAAGASISGTACTYQYIFFDRSQDIPEGKFARLLPIEESFLMTREPPVSTITWFRGDIDKAEDWLEKRVEAIVNENLWLSGRITQVGSQHAIVYGSSYDSDIFSVESEYHSPISRSTPAKDLAELCQPYLVQGEGLEYLPFKVTLVPANDDNDFYALIVSMSHALCDGYTFYTISNQLSIDADVISLDASRDQGFEEMQEKMKDTFGKETVRWFQSAGFVISIMSGRFWSQYFSDWFGPRIDEAYFEVDTNAVLQSKKLTDGLPFVSSNDVITSWFFQASSMSFGMMVVNMRNRVEGITNDIAGNYEFYMGYRKPDFQSPAMIRKSVTNLRRSNSCEATMPTFWETVLFDRNIVGITSWTSFAKEVSLPESIEEFHLPLFDFRSLLGSNVCMAVLFRRKGSELGFIFGGPSDAVERIRNIDGPLGSEMM